VTDIELLAYFAEYEAKGWHPVAQEDLTRLATLGLLTSVNVGWGHRRVALTAAGKRMLEGK
jgi:hypothetical protein